MVVFTRSRDAAEYMRKLEDMVIAMATDISNLLSTDDACLRPQTVDEVMEDYSFVVSEPSVMEEVLHEQYGRPYLERESNLAHLVKMGAVIRCDI